MRKLLNLSERISKYLIAAVLVIIPLLPKFPLLRVPGTYVSIRFEDILMLVLALVLIPKIVIDFKSLWKDRIIRAFGIFFALTLVSLISGVFITETATLKFSFLHWARRLEYIIPFLAVYLLTPKDKIRERLVFYFKILIIDMIILFVYGFGQRYFGLPIIITQNEEYSKGVALWWTPGAHINSTFAGHYDLSAFIVLVIPMILGAIFVFKNKLIKLVLSVVSGMGLWLLISSVSRSSQLTYLFAVTVSFFLLKKFKAWLVVIAISLACMLMSGGLYARFAQGLKVLYEHVTTGAKFSYLGNFTVKADEVVLDVGGRATPTPAPITSKIVKDVSIAIRYNVEWPRAIRAFTKNPLLGTGYSSIDLATDNDYLRMLGETGILGFLAFILVLGNVTAPIIKSLFIQNRFDPFEKCFLFGLLGGLLATLASALLIDVFEASKFAISFWLFMGLGVVLVKSKDNEH